MKNEYILFKSLAGSYLYGTNSDSSDKDYKGVFLPDFGDLILAKAPKHYTLSTGKSGERNSSDDIDETYYSLHYFLELAAKGDTNAIDLLFAYTNKNAVIQTSEIWNSLIKNINKILTKNVKAYLGYCKGQCIKYSVKGSKLNNFKKFKDFCERHIHDVDKNGRRLSIKEILINQLGDFEKYIPEPDAERIKFDRYDFGDHCYITTSWNKEHYISISDVKIDLNDDAISALHKIKRTIESYGKRAEVAEENNGADYKAISHCIRVLFEVEEILIKHKIEFPLKEKDFIKSIKYKTTALSRDEIMDWIEKKIAYIESNLIENSNLQDKADFKWIKNCICKSYGIYSSFFN